MKKFSYFLLNICAIFNAYAGIMGDVCSQSNISLPCSNSSWVVGGQALYLSTTRTGRAAILETVDDSNGVSNLISSVPGWGWGFEVSSDYKFSSGKDFNINWYHLNTSESKKFSNGSYNLLDGPNISYLANLKSEWDAVNIEFGQQIIISDASNIHYYGGAEYVRLLGDAKLTRLSNANFASITSVYNGFGPRVGVDLNYNIVSRLNVYGKTATTLLVGTNKQFISDRNGLINKDNNNSLFFHGSLRSVVPALEGKLGGNYVFVQKTSKIIFELGYLWVNYFNPLLAGENDTNVGFNGLYFGANWKGNIV